MSSKQPMKSRTEVGGGKKFKCELLRPFDCTRGPDNIKKIFWVCAAKRRGQETVHAVRFQPQVPRLCRFPITSCCFFSQKNFHQTPAIVLHFFPLNKSALATHFRHLKRSCCIFPSMHSASITQQWKGKRSSFYTAVKGEVLKESRK